MRLPSDIYCQCKCGFGKPPEPENPTFTELKRRHAELIDAARAVLGAKIFLTWGRRHMRPKYERPFDRLEEVIAKEKKP